MKEDYRQNHKRHLESILESCLWRRVSRQPGMWEKGRSRILVDNQGIYLYRLAHSTWRREAGRSHDLITADRLREREIKFQDFRLDLFTGEVIS